MLITLPHGCQGGASLRRYCEHLCDAVVSLNDFKGEALPHIGVPAHMLGRDLVCVCACVLQTCLPAPSMSTTFSASTRA